MARPKQCRWVEQKPNVTFFKPCGVPLTELDTLILKVEELEALRLSDLEGLSTSEAAQKMRVSRFSFARTLKKARQLVAQTLIEGKALRIEGGHFAVSEPLNAPQAKLKDSSFILAISCQGPSLDDLVDARYGRAGGFLIVNFADPHNLEISYLDNGDSQLLEHEAGIVTTKHLVDAKVKTVITGTVGPKALKALEEAKISVIQGQQSLTAREALQRYLEAKS
ncbi:MAG: DUF134 domain-containing protein [Desulfovibrionaceae bacterium]|nr:DUF134 domain-containing protein [Desulfovibrionaceae bacterium]